MAHEARYAFKVGDKLVTLTVEAPVKASTQPKCCVCGNSRLETKAYNFLRQVRLAAPEHPRLSAAEIARQLGVQYHQAMKVCMTSSRIKLESWNVNSPRYTCRDFYVD